MTCLLLLWLLVFSCAKVGPPSGGPVDRTPPEIVEHWPSADATAVPLDAAIELEFSKRMDRQRTQAAIFCSPEGKIRFRWRGRRLRLELDLEPGQTYVITVGAEARDLRGNALQQSFTFAFATGLQLNRGRIEGFVYRDHQPASGVHVWAYDLERFKGRFGRDTPHYRTQSGRNGQYAFARLAAGRYRLLAFIDENRSRSYDPGEWLALPAADLQVSEVDTARAGDLALVQHLMPALNLLRARALDSRRWLLEFSRPVVPEELEVTVRGLPIEAIYASSTETNRLYLRTAEQEAGREYVIVSLKVKDQIIDWRETVRGSGRPEMTLPELVETYPREGPIAVGDSLRLFFSKAMAQEVPEDFWIRSDSTQAPAGRWHWGGPTVLSFVPDPFLVPGDHRFQGRLARLRDLADLRIKELLVEFSFTALGIEQLAAIQGQVQDIGGVARVTMASGTRTYHTWSEERGDFGFAGILPGRYFVHAFVDLNGDGSFGPGNLFPFVQAEPYCRAREQIVLDKGQIAEFAAFECW